MNGVAQVDRAPAEGLEVAGSSPATVLSDPLSPENLQPKCTVCTNPVPKQRVSTRTRFTCGPACLKVLQEHKKHMMKMHMCMVCQRPCTPEEKKEFIAFRKHRGEVRLGPGRPTTEQKVQKIKDALRQAIKFLEEEIAGSLNDGYDGDIDGFLEQTKILLDGKAAKSTLAASGETTGGES